MTVRVAVVVFDGVDELDAIGPFEVLRSAAQAGAPLEVVLAALDAPRMVEGSHGLRFEVRDRLDAGGWGWVVVAGGNWAARGERGAWAEIQRGDLPRALAALGAAGVKMASVCTGAMLLSAAGLTRGRRVTTHHLAIEALRQEGGVITPGRVVDDGDLVTAGGVTSGIDLGLHLIERLVSRGAADRIEARLEYGAARRGAGG